MNWTNMDDSNLTIPCLKLLREFVKEPSKRFHCYALSRSLDTSAGGVFKMLMKLEERGWIEGQRERVNRNLSARPPRKLYRITDAGKTGYSEITKQFR